VRAVHDRMKISFRFFIASWIDTLAAPCVIAIFWLLPGAILGVVLPVLWLLLMPKTCINGAFVAFPMAIIQLAAGMTWLLPLIKLLRHHS